ncbi:MAG: terminase small subunit [Janthinobacterium lividum]
MPTEPITLTAYEQLTEKQRGFVDALCEEPNISGTKAAEVAGYAKSGAHVEATRLLRNAKVRKALGEQLKDTAPSTEEIALRWDRVSRSSLDDFFTKRKKEVKTTIKQPLAEAIAAIEEDIRHERELMERTWQVLGTSEEVQGKELLEHTQWEKRRRVDMLRYEMKLERDPKAFRLIDGPPRIEEELVLDLAKAQRKGVLDMARSIKPTRHGIGIELRDPDVALDKLARIAGSYEKDNEQSAAKITGLTVTIRTTGKEGSDAA